MPILPDMIGLVVHDLAVSLQFYRLLGLDIPTGNEAEPYVEVITPNGYRISWNTVDMIKSIDPGWEEPTGQGISLAFKCDSPQEVDHTYGRLVSSGYEGYTAPFDAFWGQRYAVLIDPDGYHVDVFAPL